ncbi:hypothetical protein AQI95_15005 [Streptomyces yokosukanensis]|uniref:Uncharacterized protein n=1 Tax=Streptomyces yokosukanensis TaxID=67386 RepID=A0A101P763_9ACTN|nr:hypothetical protein [Streptomyces yokosukanensis]KUN06199.1 hypothetical protein AQI95_15005 [Streptomyces yokosukanensis]
MSAFFGHPEPRLVLDGEYPCWDEPLAAVNRDLAATLPDQRPLRLIAYPESEDLEYVYVALSKGEAHGNALIPTESAAEALTAVADAAQDTVSERLWRAWPLCTVHDLGMHPRDIDGRPSWWCAGGPRPGDPAHLRAAIGELDTVQQPRPTPRKRPKNRRLR